MHNFIVFWYVTIFTVLTFHPSLYSGHRISLTFRHVTTFLRWRDGRIFGQGAPCKTEAELEYAKDNLQTEEETVRLIEAFGAENRQSNFDWDLHYGAGFSVMNMAVSGPQVGRKELIRTASQLPHCELQPSDFFLAWNGVLTLVFEGFPFPLTAIKQALNNIPDLKNENFGSMWPKATLAATNDDSLPLTLQELKQLRALCHQYSAKLKQASTMVSVNEVCLVKYNERSLETATAITTVKLLETSSSKQMVSEEEKARVRTVLEEWEGDNIDAYLDKANAPGSRASTYRTASPSGCTVVAFLSKAQNTNGDELRRLMNCFRQEVDTLFPGRFSWMSTNSLHCTLRSLDS